MAKLPYLQFFVSDWESDEKLRLCSLAAQGFWMRLICTMHKSDRRGFLQQANGSPLSLEQTARIAGCSTDEAAHLLQELITTGAASVSDTGVIYCRRMVRDERKRELCAEAGKKGGGNPSLQTYKGHPKGVPKGDAKGTPKHPLDYGDGDGSSTVGKGGVGEREGARGTPESIAAAWCWRLKRKKNGYPEDRPDDIAALAGELIRTGTPGDSIQAEVERNDRDWAEYFWQLKKRLQGSANASGNLGQPHRIRTGIDYDAAAKRKSGPEAVGGKEAG